MRPTIWLLLILLVLPPVHAAAPTGTRWVEASLDLAAPDLRTVEITAELRIHKETIDGETLTAADMAEAYREDREEFERSLEREVNASFAARLAELFPDAQRAIDDVALDRASVDAPRGDAYDPPVRVSVAAHVTRSAADLGLGNLTDAQVSAAFAAGVIVSTEVTLRAQPGDSFTYTIHAPQAPRRLVFADGREAATVTLDNARGIDDLVKVAPLKLKDAVAKPPAREDATVSILIDLQDVEVTAGQAAKRDFGTLRAHVLVDSDVRAVAVPPEALARLGPRVELPFVSSDGVRLALDSGLLTPADVQSLDRTLLDTLSQGLSKALGSPVEADGGLDAATLDFHAESNFSMRLSQSPSGTAAISLYSIPQSLTLPKVRGLDTTYTIVLPPGLAVSGLQAQGGQATTRQTSDGRQEIVVTPTESQATATLSIGVTPAFVLAKFWPAVLLGVLLLVLLAGTPVAVIVLRRRRGKTE